MDKNLSDDLVQMGVHCSDIVLVGLPSDNVSSIPEETTVKKIPRKNRLEISRFFHIQVEKRLKSGLVTNLSKEKTMMTNVCSILGKKGQPPSPRPEIRENCLLLAAQKARKGRRMPELNIVTVRPS